MNHIALSLVFFLFLTGKSFAAVSLFEMENQAEKFVVESVSERDPAQIAVRDFNEGRHLAAVLRAETLAETGNPFAHLILGLAYQSGKGIEKSLEQALLSYRQAGEAGNTEASYRLARLLVEMGGADRQKEAQSVLETLAQDKEADLGKASYYLGEGSLKGWFGETPNFNQTKTWWEKSSAQGNVTSMIGLARLLEGEFGFPEKRDPAAALSQYLNAARQGYGPAMTRAGARLLKDDEEQAREWLKQAIKKKQFEAYLVLGDFAEYVTKSDQVAFAEYLKGAESGNGPCMLRVASFFMEGRAGKKKSAQDAIGWLKKAGAAGEVLGHVQAAKILLRGEGLNIVDGYNHLVVAAESGLVDMQNELGLLYLSGRLGVRDAAAAASWFRRSAQGKYPAGVFNLAALHEQGVGVPQNFDQAGRLYTLAANTGHAQSTTALGRFHAEGRGTKQDLPRAWALFSLAVERGDQAAQKFIEQVAENLAEGELKKAGDILRELKQDPVPAEQE